MSNLTGSQSEADGRMGRKMFTAVQIRISHLNRGPHFFTKSLAIADHAGIRALLTHPIEEDAEAFYRRFGFESTPAHDRQLILRLKDA